MGKRIFLVAAEASGDALGADLIVALKKRDPSLEFAGVGGAAMAALGVNSLFDIAPLSVLGIVEGIQAYSKVVKLADKTAEGAVAFNPDAVVLIDSWGFTLRVAQRLAPLLPNAPLNAEGLSRLDARIAYRAANVRTGTIPLQNLQLTLGLDNRLLTLKPVRFDFAGGTLTGNIDLNARRSPVVTRYDVNLSPVRIADLLRGFNVESSGTNGVLKGRLHLTGYGDDVPVAPDAKDATRMM